MLETALIQSLFPLIAICAFLGITLILIKKYALKSKKNKSQGFDLNVISRLSLHQKNHLFVVKAGQKTLLLGATDHNINILSDLSEVRTKPELSSTFPSVNADRALTQPEQKQIINKKQADALSFKSFLRSTLSKS